MTSPLSRAEQAREELREGGVYGYCTSPPELLIPEGAVILTREEAEQVRDVCLRAILHTGPRARKREGSSIQPLRDDLRAMVALLSAGQPGQAGK